MGRRLCFVRQRRVSRCCLETMTVVKEVVELDSVIEQDAMIESDQVNESDSVIKEI